MAIIPSQTQNCEVITGLNIIPVLWERKLKQKITLLLLQDLFFCEKVWFGIFIQWSGRKPQKQFEELGIFWSNYSAGLLVYFFQCLRCRLANIEEAIQNYERKKTKGTTSLIDDFILREII